MRNALSPFYSQDPRTTHLGFRAGVVPQSGMAGRRRIEHQPARRHPRRRRYRARHG